MASISFGVPFAVGNNVSLAAITPITGVNATGTYTLGSQLDLKTLSVWKMGEFTADANLAMIKPADGTVENNVFLYDGWEFRVGEIPSAGGTGGGAGFLSVLEATWGTYRYIRAQMQTRNPWATASACNLTVIGIRSHFEHSFVEDEHALVLVLKPCGILPDFTTGTPAI